MTVDSIFSLESDFRADEDLGKVDGQFAHALGGCRVRVLMRGPYYTLDRRRSGVRIIKMLHALSASCVFPLQLYASLPRTCDWLFSLMSASCLGLRPSCCHE